MKKLDKNWSRALEVECATCSGIFITSTGAVREVMTDRDLHCHSRSSRNSRNKGIKNANSN
jgi:hypothetical protein